MLEVHELTKAYNDRIAINKISFKAKKGEILGLLGPNGAGKSTTMKILSGFMPATSGYAKINGFDMATQPIEGKSCLGYLPEIPPIYAGMDVESYLTFAAELHGVPKAKLKAAVSLAMEKCSVHDVRKRLIGNLSKGYKQRVGLAQAIAHNPAVLILDEPTVGLDPKQIIEIRNLIKSFEKEHTVLLSTHILPEVQATCSRVVVIDQGKLIAEDTLSGIASRMQSSARVHLLVKENPVAVIDSIKNINGVTMVHQSSDQAGFHLQVDCAKGAEIRADLSELVVQQKLGLLGLDMEQLSLEDAFIKLVGYADTTQSLQMEKQ